MTSSSVDQLKSAVYTLYHDSNDEQRENANVWLQEWQRSDIAWTVCHQVLRDGQSDLETCYFAAQTLRTKILRDFEELEHDVGRTLPESIMGILSLRASGPGAVRTQLCLAIAALALHIPASEWEGGDLIHWIGIRMAGSQVNDSMQHILLEILMVVPQEAGTYQPSILPERRRKIHEEMEALLPQALGLLSSMSNTNTGLKLQEQVLEAFAAWLRLSGNKVPPSCLLDCPLVQVALGALQNEDFFFSAVDTIIEIIYCSSLMGKPKPELSQLVQVIVSQIMSLLPRFHICIQQAVGEESHLQEDSHFDDYEEKAKSMARLFAEVGEAYAHLICEATPEVMGPVEALLDVCRYPDMEICSISFNFWHRVSYILSSGRKPHSLNWEGVALPEQEAQRRIDVFRPCFERLVGILSRRIEYPQNCDTWHSNEKSEFKHVRQTVGDLLLDATDVLGPDGAIAILVAPLSEISSQMQAGGQFDWRKAESSLYCLRSVHKASLNIKDGSILLSLLSALPSLPSHPLLDYSVALMLGSYSEWLCSEAKSSSATITSLITSLTEMLIKGLGNEHTGAACALSLRNICHDCGSYLIDCLPNLLELYRQVQRYGDMGSGEAFLDEEDVENVMEAVTFVVSTLPRDSKRNTVRQMIDSVVQPIQVILEPVRSGVAVDMHQVALVLPLFERVTTILRNADDVEDVAATLERLLPWIEIAFNVFLSDPVASEKVCRLPRYAVRTAKEATFKSLPMLANLLMVKFEHTKHSCFLFVASELVKSFGHDAAQDRYLQPLLQRMLSSSCSMLTSLQLVSLNPELTDDTFLLAGRGLSYAVRLMMNQDLLTTLIVTSRNALLVQHREACSSVASFLVRLLDPGTHRKCSVHQVKALETVFQPYASFITQLTIAGAVGALPISRIHDMVDVLYALLKSSGTSYHWINSALALLPDSALPHEDKSRFLDLCRRIVSDDIQEEDERHLLDAMVELSEVCRRHHKVQKTVMLSLLPTEYQYFNV